MAADAPEATGLYYARALYQTVLRCYENADAKANILLALDGALVSFLSGAVFVKRDDLAAIVGGFGGGLWACLAVMARPWRCRSWRRRAARGRGCGCRRV